MPNKGETVSDATIVKLGILAVIVIAVVSIAPAFESQPQPTEQATILTERLAARDEQLASYRLYSSEMAKSLVSVNQQLREAQSEVERLQRENMRLEQRAMGLVETDE